jgi:hypothetical protein
MDPVAPTLRTTPKRSRDLRVPRGGEGALSVQLTWTGLSRINLLGGRFGPISA